MTIVAKKLDINSVTTETVGPTDDYELEITTGTWQVSYVVDTRLGRLGSSAVLRPSGDAVVRLVVDDTPESVTSYLEMNEVGFETGIKVGTAKQDDPTYLPPKEVERVDLEIDLAVAGIERRYVKDIQHAVADAVDDVLGHGPAMTTRVTALSVDEIREQEEEEDETQP